MNLTTQQTNNANSHSSSASVVPASSASSSSDDFCDICWANPRAKIVFVPCHHARFCDSRAHQMSATTKNVASVEEKLTCYCLFLVN